MTYGLLMASGGSSSTPGWLTALIAGGFVILGGLLSYFASQQSDRRHANQVEVEQARADETTMRHAAAKFLIEHGTFMSRIELALLATMMANFIEPMLQSPTLVYVTKHTGNWSFHLTSPWTLLLEICGRKPGSSTGEIEKRITSFRFPKANGLLLATPTTRLALRWSGR